MPITQRRNSAQKRWLKNELSNGSQFVQCCFCRVRLTVHAATLEHVIPLAEGGNWKKPNLTLSCSGCNNERGTADFHEFRDWKRGLRASRPIGKTSYKPRALNDLLDSLSAEFRTKRE